MIPQIKPKDIENELFTIKETNKSIIDIPYIDFAYKTPPAIQSQPTLSRAFSSSVSFSPLAYKKTICLDSLVFNNYNSITANDITKELQKQFIIKITELGKKHRDESELKSILDIVVSDIKKNILNNSELSQNIQNIENLISRHIISKFISNSNNIAIKGRIGPGNFLISNIATYNHILTHLDNTLEYDDNNILKISSLKYFVDDSVEDDIILIGRKNNIDQPGVHCLIETDENNFIKFRECKTHTIFNNTINNFEMYYQIFDIGLSPEYQYYATSIRNIAYYRNKKLQKINKYCE